VIGERTDANLRFFEREADRIAELSMRLAERFRAGGRLLAVGASAQDWSDARHVAVEFVHPVIVGKRALPALALTAAQAAVHAGPDDAVIAFGAAPAVPRGCLTIGFAPGVAEWTFEPASDDPFVRQELVETLYHVLSETVHVFLEHSGSSDVGAGASAFLYPFLERPGTDVGSVLADVAASVLIKAGDVAELRERSVGDGRALDAAAAAVHERLEAGGKLVAFGNGGSATDAMDLVADLRSAGRRARPHGRPGDPDRARERRRSRGALPEAADRARPDGDVALAFSTTGGSANILLALEEARRGDLLTVAIVGYDGGRILAEGLADHVIRAPSEYIPRIQEAHATVYHLLCERVAGGARIPAGAARA
jgi:D-sedoheptulose 7-phosphate isomerase